MSSPRHHLTKCGHGCGWQGQRTGDTAAIALERPCPRCGAPAILRSDRAEAGDVLATCIKQCGRGAIYVPEVGPMGDEQCATIAEARAMGTVWEFDGDGWICPDCARAEAA